MDQVTRQEDWDVCSVLEVFSASAGRWYVACVIAVDAMLQMLTVQFWASDGSPKNKHLMRDSEQLAELGTHTSELPPGFSAFPSESRPEHFTFFDSATGEGYASLEEAWQVYFDRLLYQPEAVQEVAEAPPSPQDGESPPPPTFSTHSFRPTSFGVEVQEDASSENAPTETGHAAEVGGGGPPIGTDTSVAPSQVPPDDLTVHPAAQEVATNARDFSDDRPSPFAVD